MTNNSKFAKNMMMQLIDQSELVLVEGGTSSAGELADALGQFIRRSMIEFVEGLVTAFCTYTLGLLC